jgi:hypothetical protein
MENFKKLAICAMFVPTVMFTSSTLSAQGQPTSSSPQQTQQGTQQNQLDTQRDRQNTQRTGTPRSGQNRGDADRHNGQHNAATDSQHGASRTTKNAEFLTTTPTNAFRIENVIGSSLHLQFSDEEAGTIDDLILDESGQIIAVVISMGGFLGIGESTVAVSWDSIERRMNDDRDGYMFSVNATEDSLRAAPSYDNSVHARRIGSSNE